MRYVAGLDGGGTKTAVTCLSADGTVIGTGAFGTLNINGAPESALIQTLCDVTAYLRTLPGGLTDCAAITIATAGISNPDCARIMEKGLRQGGYQGAFEVRGDHEAALRGAVGDVGAVLVAGTGSICYGRGENGDEKRTGGRGYLIDDEGSGYAIGRDILKAAVRAQDGRIPPTPLYPAAMDALGLQDMGELIHFVYAPERKKQDTAALAPLLIPALRQGDKAALAIAAHAADELALLCYPVIETLALQQSELALTGSILTHYEEIQQGLKDKLAARYPDLRPIAPRGDSAMGAARLALKLANRA